MPCTVNEKRGVSMLPGYRPWRGRPRGGTAIRWPADRASANGAQAHAQRRRRRTAAPPSSRSGRGFPRRVAIPEHKQYIRCFIHVFTLI